MSDRNIFDIGPPLAKALADLATQLQEFLGKLEPAVLAKILVDEIKRLTKERDEARAERDEAIAVGMERFETTTELRFELMRLRAELFEQARADGFAAALSMASNVLREAGIKDRIVTDGVQRLVRERDEARVEREQMRGALEHAYLERDIAQQTLRQVLGPDDEPAPWVDVMCCDCGVSDDVPLYPQNGTAGDATKWRCEKCCEALESAGDRMRCAACSRFITEDQVRKVGVVLDGVMREMTPHCVHCLPSVKLR